MKKENTPSRNSPKNKFRAEINYDKALSEIGSCSSVKGMTLDEVKHNTLFYIEQAKRNKVNSKVIIFENKLTYPLFEWVKVEEFWTDKRKQNGGNSNAGAKKKVRVEGDEPKNTTVQIEPSIIEACRKKHGSIANALRFAAK